MNEKTEHLKWSAFNHAAVLFLVVLAIIVVIANQIKGEDYSISYTGKVIAVQHYGGGGFSPNFTDIILSDGTQITLKGVWELNTGETYTIDGIANKELRGITVQNISTN